MSSKAPSRRKNTAQKAEKTAKKAAAATPARASECAPGLYVVATPIGNAADITLRALDVLRAADVVAAEDTRVTAKLLAIHGIRASLIAYHDHNADRQRPKLIEQLKSGAIVAQVTDAGTPLISDPGLKLAEAARAEGVTVTALPGASSVTNALVLSGLATDRFFFEGFLPQKHGQRMSALDSVQAVPATLVFMESPKRLAASLADMASVLGERKAAVCREMTKKFEEVRRGTLAELAEQYTGEDEPKGEVVVVVAPPGKDEAAASADEIDRLLTHALETMSVRDAAETVAKAVSAKKKDVYARALELAERK